MGALVPNRILREGILTSEPVNALSWPAEVFYRRLISVVDDFGRYYAKPELLRAACYPLKLDIVGNQDVAKWLAECAGAGLVRTYAIDGKDYLEIENFKQRVRAENSKFPAVADIRPSNDGHVAVSRRSSARLDVVEVEVEGDNARARAEPPGFTRFWATWPPGERKQAKGECAKKWRQKGCEAETDAILAHVEAMKSSSDWQQGFVPAPLVYLNQRRWQGANVAPKVRRVAL